MAELVEGARLEIVYTLIAYPGFESLSLRHDKEKPHNHAVFLILKTKVHEFTINF